MIDISDYSLFLRETVSSKKEDKGLLYKRILLRTQKERDFALPIGMMRHCLWNRTSYTLKTMTSRSRSIVCTITAID